MSHCTADLEYFKCDMCHVYFHRDIFCPHRRECKGKDSQELKKDEVAVIADRLDEADRREFHQMPKPLDKIAKKRNVNQRTDLANDYAKEQEAKSRLSTAEMHDLFEELNA